MLPARVLLGLFDSIYAIALTSWTGAILFFSFGVAPIIFKVLDPAQAARFVRALFPRYYAWGAISCAIALPALVAGPLTTPELRGPMIAVQSFMILAGLLLMFYCGNSLTPAINTARDLGAEGQARFDRLHKLSVRLNAISLLIGLALLVLFATRPAPRSAGIVEMTPIERVQYDGEVLDEIDRQMRRQPPAASKSATPGLLDDEGKRELKDLIDAKLKRDEARRKSK